MWTGDKMQMLPRVAPSVLRFPCVKLRLENRGVLALFARRACPKVDTYLDCWWFTR